MANNKLDKVYLSKDQLDTIANGGTITSGSDTYDADESALYLTDDDAVSYNQQSLTTEQKAQARTNIGAGTSDFSGSYNDLTDKPTIPTDTGATSVEVTGSGNAIDSASYDGTTRKLTLTKGITALTSHQDISGKQDKTDNSLDTTSKTVAGAINEVNSLAKQSNKAKGFTSYSALITELNSASSTTYNVGQSFYIQTLDVPDLWIISVESTSSSYTYTTDSAFITATGASGGQQVGYYKIAQLETQKVDLTNYSTKSETVSNISYDSTNKKLQKTINGTTSDVVTFGANAFNSTTIPTSVNGLAGGELTSPLIIDGGDAATSHKIRLGTSGNITASDVNETATLFGRSGATGLDLLVGHASFNLKLRGSGTRPTFNGSNMALYSDIPTVTSTYSSTGTNAVNGTAVASAISTKANSSDLGTQCTFTLSGTTLTITPK